MDEHIKIKTEALCRTYHIAREEFVFRVKDVSSTNEPNIHKLKGRLIQPVELSDTLYMMVQKGDEGIEFRAFVVKYVHMNDEPVHGLPKGKSAEVTVLGIMPKEVSESFYLTKVVQRSF